MNTASLAMRKYNERDQFPEGFRIDTTKNHPAASKMFIGGLSQDLSKEVLMEYLLKFGEIIDFIIKIDPITSLSRGFGFVIFKDSSTVEKVLRVKDHEVDDKKKKKKIELKRAKDFESQFTIKKVFVGGLNPRMSEEKIRAYFSTFGKIEAIELPLCLDTQERRAFGFIKYMDENPARKVLETRYHFIHFIGSSRCEVKVALPKEYLRRQQSISMTRAKDRARTSVQAAGLESHWGGEGNQVHSVDNSDPQEANQDAHRTGPYTFRTNSDITMENASGLRDTPDVFLSNPNLLGTNSSAFRPNHNAFRSNSNTVGVSHYALQTNSNTSWANHYAHGASSNAFRTSQYTLGTCPNALGVNHFALTSYQNAFGVNQCALEANSNVFWTNQHPLGTNPNSSGVSQHGSGTSPNAWEASQYTLNISPDAFRPNYHAFMGNPYNETSHYVLETNSNVLRTSPYPLEASPNAFRASQYALGATHNIFGANQHGLRGNENFYGAIGSGGSTEELNFSSIQQFPECLQ